ncbi:uncharacterized protein LOC116428275 [Nomia melanderi]|uniref:uncharacterized protein LOC116428275 n=1 Tax=Nomia melanderi TaxID=2448451 RepID=UPI0013047B33|nr:uncharacterized protein LOC116428275 [Nomia melanderi]
MPRSRYVEYAYRRPGLALLLLLPVGLLASLYVASFGEDYAFEPRHPGPSRWYNVAEETMDGYLVWNPRCQMPSKEPLDPAVRPYVRKEKFESCSTDRPITGLAREENGTVVLFVDTAATAFRAGARCCWSAVLRAANESSPRHAPSARAPRSSPSDGQSADGKRNGKRSAVDSSIVVKRCERFEGNTTLPDGIEAAMVSCSLQPSGKPFYRNVHAVLGLDKVRSRFRRNDTVAGPLTRKLSVLMIGIDSVSRLNFLRSAPITDKYLRDTGWVRFNGYNKMADNTFPNLMAILTGQSLAQSYSRCKPTVPYGLDRCPFLWRNFRDAGYATAYGEDETGLNTFNYMKVGFVEPPTDYYLRPYMLACEKLLKVRKRFGLKYCTGPETSFDRILDYALEFARTFLGLPFFGFFWTSSVSHENANGLSSMDARLHGKLRYLEREGVLNDTMVVFLSDHGMRWGPIRNTFVGWYEERLPFLYLWLPEWFRLERPDAYSSLRGNRHRLVSPFDLYQTLREVLALSGGEASPSPACPDCRSLLGPVPRRRGCADVGISSHWCACTAFSPADPRDPIVEKGARAFLEHANARAASYKDDKGRRLCAKLRLKKVHRVDRVTDSADSSGLAYFYLIQLLPGDGKFEVTVRYHENASYTVSDHEVSRISSYALSAKCLDRGLKLYCHCIQ